MIKPNIANKKTLINKKKSNGHKWLAVGSLSALLAACNKNAEVKQAANVSFDLSDITKTEFINVTIEGDTSEVTSATISDDGGRFIVEQSNTDDFKVMGGKSNDIIVTSAGDDAIDAGAGDDIISGGAGADTIRGGAGNDEIYGGEGKDNLVVVGFNQGGKYTQDDISNPNGTGIDLSGLLSVDDINNNAQSDVANGGVIDGGADGATLFIYGDVDLTNVTLLNITVIDVHSTLTLTVDQLKALTEAELEAINGDGESHLIITATDAATTIDLSKIALTDIGHLTIGENVTLIVSNLQVNKIETLDGHGAIQAVQEEGSLNIAGKSVGKDLTIINGSGQNLNEKLTVDLSSMDSSSGFAIKGAAGVSVSHAGDVNGDGFADIIIGDTADRGQAYVVFGDANGSNADIDLSKLNGENGFKLVGNEHNNGLGFSVSSAGDFNGDGYDDVIIGDPFRIDTRGNFQHVRGQTDYRGEVVVIYGKKDGFEATIYRDKIDGNNGHVIDGGWPTIQTGYSVAGLNDTNGDGLDDYVVSSINYYDDYDDYYELGATGDIHLFYGDDNYVPKEFLVYQDFWRTTTRNGNINREEFSNKIKGFGSVVANAGDFNGDGRPDIIVSGVNSAVIRTGTSPIITLPTSESGRAPSVSSAGDFNGDGHADVLVGDRISADSQKTYIRFGGDKQADLNIITNTKNGNIDTVSSAGDFNNDGYDDIILKDYDASTNSSSYYVLFGTPVSPYNNFNIKDIAVTSRVKIDLPTDGETEQATTVSNAGDVNGDGFDDIIISDTNSSNSYVVYGFEHQVSAGPVAVSGGTFKVGENRTDIGKIQFKDVYGNENGKLTYKIIGGADAHLFKIDSKTGEVSFINALNYELPLNADNQYELNIRVVDEEQRFTDQLIKIEVNDEKEGVLFDKQNEFSINENTFKIGKVEANDDRGGDVFFGLAIAKDGSSADDSKYFSIDAKTGELSFKQAPNFESPYANGGDGSSGDNNYSVKVIVASSMAELNTALEGIEAPKAPLAGTDAWIANLYASLGLANPTSTAAIETPEKPKTEVNDKSDPFIYETATQSITVKVEDMPEHIAHKDSTKVFSIDENTTYIGQAIKNEGLSDDISYYIIDIDNALSFFVSSADKLAEMDLFTIDESNGKIYFKQAPDFENPYNFNNTFVIDVMIIDNSKAFSFSFSKYSIFVKDVDDTPPSITSTDHFTLDENTTAVGKVVATGANNEALTYSFANSSKDAELFDINSKGEISFKTAPDYEDSSVMGHSFQVNVVVSNGRYPTEQSVIIKVNNINDNGPTITSAANFNVNENSTGVGRVVATDADKDAIEYSLGTGGNSNLFNINSSTGDISLKDAVDYETATPADLEYTLKVKATDGENIVEQDIKVTLKNVNERPSITSELIFTPLENQTLAGTVITTDPDGDNITYSFAPSFAGYDDHELFNLDSTTGELRFKSAPDFENLTPSGTFFSLGNDYFVVIEASDGYFRTSENIYINVKDVNENPNTAPVFTSGTSFLIDENNRFVGMVKATDAHNDTITYSIGSGGDAALFDIAASSGEISFKVAPDYESSSHSTQYNLNIVANDGSTTSTQAVSVSVNDLTEEAPTQTLPVPDGTTGFGLSGLAAYDYFGSSASALGDINGDGFADFIIGAKGADNNGYESGSSYVVFGKAGDSSASFDVSGLNGTNGFRLDGGSAGDVSGYSVSSAGDINNDGKADFIIGAPGADHGGDASGAAYLIFGKASGFGSTFNLDSVDGSNGFRLEGGSAGDEAGVSVTAAGDINGDGYVDFVVGAPGTDHSGVNAGSIYVVYGKQSGFSASVDLDSLSGYAGFRINGVAAGDALGGSVSVVGDINGDGHYDIMVHAKGADHGGADTGSSYIIFGKAGGFGDLVSLADLNGGNGFRIDGEANGRFEVLPAGDLNGDGKSDLIIVKSVLGSDGKYTTSAYGMFGKASGFTGVADFGSLTGSNGYKIEDIPQIDYSGYTVTSAGDLNKDGIIDYIVGAADVDANGTDSGAAFVVYGVDLLGGGSGSGNSPVFTSSATFSAAENQLSVGTLTATDADGDNLAFSKADGGDVDLFNVSTAGVITFIDEPDYEDNSHATSYNLKVNVGDGVNQTQQDLVINVTDVNEAVLTITSSAAISVNENSAIVGQIEASTTDGGDLTFTNVSGGDGALFNVDATGAITFVNAPDYENPVNSNHQYTLNITVSDGVTTKTQTITVTVDDVNETTGTFNISTLSSSTGFRIDGAVADGWLGSSVSAAGDINDDGIADFVVVASNANINGSNSGSSYVVFGKAGGYNANFNVSTLDGSNGFRIDGGAAGDMSGVSIASIGDFDGDDIDDLIIGAANKESVGGDSNAGAAYIIYGKSTSFGATMNLDNITSADGIKFSGEYEEHVGSSVAGLGDFNDDGKADVIIGAKGVSYDKFGDPLGENTGAAYIVYGTDKATASSLGLSALDGNAGFGIYGVAEGDELGYSVASAGDVNGDNKIDFIVSADATDHHGSSGDSGSAYVIFGTSAGIYDDFNLSTLNGSNGFRLDGNFDYGYMGKEVASAGDINNDGFDDVIITPGYSNADGSNGGSAFVVYGKGTGFSATLNLSTMSADDGFKIVGAKANDAAGQAVASLGDVNGDDIDDLFIGAAGVDTNASNAGSGYIMFGKSANFDATVNLGTITGAQGIRLDGVSANDFMGKSVAAIGDVNDDGVDDFIIGATKTDFGGDDAGSAYIVYGSENLLIA